MDPASAREALLSAPHDQFVAVMIQVLKSHRHQGGWLAVRDAARLANRSVRSLQRRLAEEGLAFFELVQAAREELARDLIADHSISINEIATRLGYSSISNFSRAFQRWTGKSPTEFRRGR